MLCSLTASRALLASRFHVWLYCWTSWYPMQSKRECSRACREHCIETSWWDAARGPWEHRCHNQLGVMEMMFLMAQLTHTGITYSSHDGVSVVEQGHGF